jgi:hypothetical protein
LEQKIEENQRMSGINILTKTKLGDLPVNSKQVITLEYNVKVT